MDDDQEQQEQEWLPALPSGKLTNSSLRRADVVQAFHLAFQMIGGIPRLALWADANPSDFYKLYARMLPSQASDEMNHHDKLEIIHSLPPPAYDPKPQTVPTRAGARNSQVSPADDDSEY